MGDAADETERARRREAIEGREMTARKEYPLPPPGRISLSLNEVCGMLGAGMTTVRKAIDAGQLPARKLGKKVIVLRADVDKFLEKLPSTRT